MIRHLDAAKSGQQNRADDGTATTRQEGLITWFKPMISAQICQ